jgi:hypothetical protein
MKNKTKIHYQEKNTKNHNFFSFNYLTKLTSYSDTQIINELSACEDLSKRINNTKFKDETIMIMTEIIYRTIKINSEPCKNIVISFLNSNFFEEVKTLLKNPEFLKIIILEYELTDRGKQIKTFFFNLFHIFRECSQKFLSLISKLPIKRFAKLIKKCNDFSEISPFFVDLTQKSNDLIITINEIQENELRKVLENRKNPIQQNIQITYMNENVNLTKEEIFENHPIIESHRPIGDYESWERYLNTMFYLVREDCYRSVRNSIQAIVRNSEWNTQLDKKLFQDIYFYPNVNIIEMEINLKGIVFTISFGVPQKKLSWSKRLMYGSLLIFSKNYFQDIIMGIVVESPDPKKSERIYNLTYYKFKVSLIDNDYKVFSNFIQSSEDQQYLNMFESKAYYESYRHILKRIQNINPITMPFTNILINHRRNIGFNLPEYFSQRSVLNYNETDFNICSDDWPKALTSSLDESQLKALKHGLRNKVAIIQGPPGTGKTYVGSILTHVLLNTVKKPILVVCFTNHALDQFLKHILNFEENIVRVGGRCKDEVLKEYTLTEIKKTRREKGSMVWIVNNQIFVLADEMKKFTQYFGRQTYMDFNNLTEIYPDFSEKLINDFYEILDKNAGNKFIKILKESFRKYSANIYDIWINPKKTKSFVNNLLNIPGIITTPNDKNFLYDFPYILNSYEGLTNTNNSDFIINKVSEKHETEINNEEEQEIINDEDDLEENIDRKEIENNEDEYDDDYIENGEIIKLERKLKDLIIEDNMQENNKINIQKILSCINNDFNYWTYSTEIRREIMFYLKKQYFQLKMKEMQPKIKLFNDLIIKKTEMENLDCVKYLEKAKIVGMTTTGCAKYSTYLEHVEFQTVIVEEAAEVLESHISSILTKNTKHLILIGDHQQLKPNPYNFEICKKFNFDVSLFERLINNSVSYESLQFQRRMRPEFADFVRIIYKKTNYIDHESTKNKPNVLGFNSNIHFLNHKYLEEMNHNLSSNANPFEAKFLAALARYITQQNYQPEKITILTMYQAQVLLIREELRKICLNVKVVSVDNYQGEENDFILLSLVRSNKKNEIGFIKSYNRICVAFSRAILGFYVVGNFDCIIAGQHDKNKTNPDKNLWSEIFRLAKSKNCIDDKFVFRC